MCRRVITLVLALALFFFAAVPASAITFGQPDDGAHPYVGTLLFQQGDATGWYSCTGTLLSSTIMLTAGHCTFGDGAVNRATYVSFAEEPFANRGDYETLQAFLDAEWIEAQEVIPHPQYNDFAEFPNTYDIGLVVLSEPVDLDTYAELPKLGHLETLRTRSDRRFTAVGYGMQGLINPFYQDDYVRYQGQTYLIELKSTRTGEAHSATFTNNPGGKGGTCFGDSGGPLLWGDTNVIGAVVSFGYTPCIGVDYQFRTDTAIAQSFIATYYPELIPE